MTGDGMEGTIVPGRPFRESTALAGYLRDGVPEPEFLCNGMLYRGHVHTISGEPESGKTTIALWWMLQTVRDGHHVMFLDEEGGDEIVAGKLAALGATPADIGRLHYFPFPHRTWNGPDVMMYLARLDEIRPALTVFDSVSAFMALAGLKENDNSDCTVFWTRVLIPGAREYHSAMLGIDHDNKDGEDSRYSRGGGAKLGLADVAYKAKIVTPFNRSQAGALKLSCNSKDRLGYLHRMWDVAVTPAIVTGNVMTLDFTRDETLPPAPLPVTASMPPARRNLLAALTPEPASIGELVDRIVAAGGHPLRRPTASTELGELAKAGLAERYETGNGRPALWSLPPGSAPELPAGNPSANLSANETDIPDTRRSDPSARQNGQHPSADPSATRQQTFDPADVFPAQTRQQTDADRSLTGPPQGGVSKCPPIRGGLADTPEGPPPENTAPADAPGTVPVPDPPDEEIF